jgi:flavodoxin/NAD-dependent dihydropyrimidine dehydrogenase PreA subunit
MKFLLITFSQTGNTRKIADVIAKTFLEKKQTVVSIPLEKANPADVSRYDCIGIGCPCFSSQAPTPVKDFLRTLPLLNKVPGFVFATSGGGPGRVLFDMAEILRTKGVDIIGGFLSRGECFHPAPSIYGKFKGRPNSDDLAKAAKFAMGILDKLLFHQMDSIPYTRPDATSLPWGFYGIAANISSDPALRLLMPKPKLDPKSCNKCEWCVKECPMKNIEMSPFPAIGNRCIRCYRCLTGCKQKAFTANWLFGNVVVWSLYNDTFERIFGDIQPGEKTN